MANATIFGIALLVAAALVLITGPLFTNLTAAIKANLSPQNDKHSYIRKNEKYKRILVLIWAVLGICFIVIGIVTGP
ncbi:hypothetical protein FHR86_003796 [Paenarthrobacter ilicis]|uniref:Uncharacterized protein n=1 Tax=Paenarthrobacter ilicis TaxID=43665 RepID=A0ABX0TRY5_9MICC|nr:hypothetical protein [Paenarthrobacter ilicis]